MVAKHNHVSRCHGSLVDFLRHQKEVVGQLPCDRVIDDSARLRIAWSPVEHTEDPRVDPLLDNHESEGGLVIGSNFLESGHELSAFMPGRCIQLGIADSVSKDDHRFREIVVDSKVLLYGLDETDSERFHELTTPAIEFRPVEFALTS